MDMTYNTTLQKPKPSVFATLRNFSFDWSNSWHQIQLDEDVHKLTRNLPRKTPSTMRKWIMYVFVSSLKSLENRRVFLPSMPYWLRYRGLIGVYIGSWRTCYLDLGVMLKNVYEFTVRLWRTTRGGHNHGDGGRKRLPVNCVSIMIIWSR